MVWNKEQQQIVDLFLAGMKQVEWFRAAGGLSDKYMVVDTLYEACDTYGQQMYKIWNRNTQAIEAEALKVLTDEQVDAVFEAVSLAIGNEVYAGLCAFEQRIEEETGEEQSELEEEVLDFIKRDTAWACVEALLGTPGFFTRVCEVNRTGRWACSWIGNYPVGNFIIM